MLLVAKQAKRQFYKPDFEFSPRGDVAKILNSINRLYKTGPISPLMFRVVFYVYQRSNQWTVENQHSAPEYFPTGSCEKLTEAGERCLTFWEKNINFFHRHRSRMPIATAFRCGIAGSNSASFWSSRCTSRGSLVLRTAWKISFSTSSCMRTKVGQRCRGRPGAPSEETVAMGSISSAGERDRLLQCPAPQRRKAW